MQLFRHILAATDFASPSRRALRVAAELARKHGARLTLLHVLDARKSEPETLMPLNPPPTAEEWENEARDRLAALAQEVAGELTGCDFVVRTGVPEKTIVEEATGRDVDLVVVGHGKSGPIRWLLGSTAEHVVRECPRPVLTVRADAAKEALEEASPQQVLNGIERGDLPHHNGGHDSTVIKIDSARSPVGRDGQKYLASGIRVSMRMWEREQPGDSPESEREYEVVGYVLSGRAELHVEGQVVRLEAGDSYVVPRHARHHYRILTPFSALEATSPPSAVHGRDSMRAAAR